MTSLAWGPVGHCTSGRPLNPPLSPTTNEAGALPRTFGLLSRCDCMCQFLF